jgi:glycosyltransferase involved in cell wall biosynthesis
MNQPIVSVCVVTYNHERFIGRCLDSVIAQKADFPFEVIVGDDASTDGTLAEVSSRAQRHSDLIAIVRSKANVGPAENYRRTHRAARGRYVAHLDGDDAMHPGKLAAQVQAFQGYPTVAGVFHDMELIDKDGRSLGETFSPSTPEFFDLRFAMINHAAAQFSSLMYRRHLMQQFMEQSDQWIDMRFYAELGALGNFRFLKTCFGRYTVGVGLSREHRLILKLLYEAIDRAEQLGFDPQDARRARAVQTMRVAFDAFRSGDAANFREFIEAAWKLGERSVAARVLHAFRFHPEILKSVDQVYRPLRNLGLGALLRSR